MMPISSAKGPVIEIEGIAPHGRPEIVALQTEKELEDVLVEIMVEASGIGVAIRIAWQALDGRIGELLFDPTREAGGLVVEEQATVLHHRLAIGIDARMDEKAIVLCYGHIGPPGPRRDTQLARELVDAILGAALIGAGDNQHLTSVALTEARGIDRGDDVLLALALELLAIDDLALDKLLDEAALLDRAYQDVARTTQVLYTEAGVVDRDGSMGLAYHLLDVPGQVGIGTQDARIVVAVGQDADGTLFGWEDAGSALLLMK